MALILFAAAVPRRVMPWAAAVIAGSVLGGLTNAWLAARDVFLPAPLTTPRMAATSFSQLTRWSEHDDASSVFGHLGEGVCPRRR
jgi:membrane protein YqaA with SNARE-associated domain